MVSPKKHCRVRNATVSLCLVLTTWNCLGLGRTNDERDAKIEYCHTLGYDILCLTELWNCQRTLRDFVVSAVDKKDRPTDVGLVFDEKF